MINIDDLRPKTLHGIKSLANKIKKRDGMKHTMALEVAARRSGYASYQAACAQLTDGGGVEHGTL